MAGAPSFGKISTFIWRMAMIDVNATARTATRIVIGRRMAVNTNHMKCLLGRWSLVVGRWSLVVGRWSLVVGRWALVVGRWSLLVGRWSLGVGRSSCVVRRWSLAGQRLPSSAAAPRRALPARW